jgi:hypothetical protein
MIARRGSRSAHTPPSTDEPDERREPRRQDDADVGRRACQVGDRQREDDERQPVADLARELREPEQAKRAVTQDAGHGRRASPAR